jgi:hypothetical protein
METRPLYEHRQAPSRAQALKGGLVAGLAGAVWLWIWNAAQNALAGAFWPTFKFAALPFYGLERVTSPGFDAGPILVGGLSHLIISVLWGLAFALVFFGLSRSATLVVGLFYGVVVWLGMFYVVLPLAGVGAVARDSPVAMAILTHFFFGLVVALAFLPFQRRLTRPTRKVHKVRPLPPGAGRDHPVTI